MITFITNLFKPVQVTDKVYKQYVDKGTVSEPIIRLIALKVVDNKELNEMELAIFYGVTDRVNAALVLIKKEK